MCSATQPCQRCWSISIVFMWTATRVEKWLPLIENVSLNKNLKSIYLILQFFKATVFCIWNKHGRVAAGTYSSGNAWMGEVGNKWGKRTREKYELRDTVQKCSFWQYPPSVRTVSLPHLLDQEGGALRQQRPPSIHPHKYLAFLTFWGPVRGKQTFLPFVRNSTRVLSTACSLSTSASWANLNEVSHPQLQSPPPTPSSKPVVGQQQNRVGGLRTEHSSLASAEPAAL